MSIFGALRSGVSGLFVQSQALATTADNIANVNTTGYKVNRVQFSTLVTNSASPTLFSSGGVQSRVARDNDVQGLLAASSSATDVAIVGQGFFTVTDEVTFNSTSGRFEPTGNAFFTRSGEFRPDQDGNLVNAAGFFLTGWSRNATDTGFEVTNVANAFSAVNISGSSAVATPTTEVTISANLQASTATGGIFPDFSTDLQPAGRPTHPQPDLHQEQHSGRLGSERRAGRRRDSSSISTSTTTAPRSPVCSIRTAMEP